MTTLTKHRCSVCGRKWPSSVGAYWCHRTPPKTDPRWAKVAEAARAQ